MAQFDGNPRDNRRAMRAIQRAFQQIDDMGSSSASEAMLLGGVGDPSPHDSMAMKDMAEEVQRYAFILGR